MPCPYAHIPSSTSRGRFVDAAVARPRRGAIAPSIAGGSASRIIVHAPARMAMLLNPSLMNPAGRNGKRRTTNGTAPSSAARSTDHALRALPPAAPTRTIQAGISSYPKLLRLSQKAGQGCRNRRHR